VFADGATVRVQELEFAVSIRLSDHVIVHGPVPVNAADKTVDPPLQIVALPLSTAVGRGFTVTVVVPAAEVQLLAMTVTLYVPPIATVALAIVGFCCVEVKPTGPVQAYVAPAAAGVDKLIVEPAQYGPVFEAVGVAGIAFTVTAVVPAADVHPFTVTVTL
jgi:hypothetical protein